MRRPEEDDRFRPRLQKLVTADSLYILTSSGDGGLGTYVFNDDAAEAVRHEDDWSLPAWSQRRDHAGRVGRW